MSFRRKIEWKANTHQEVLGERAQLRALLGNSNEKFKVTFSLMFCLNGIPFATVKNIPFILL